MSAVAVPAPKVRCIGKIPWTSDQVARLTRIGCHYLAESNPARRDDAAEIIRRIGDADGIVINIATPITSDIIAQCPQLRFVQTWSTGTDNIDLNAARKAGIQICNVVDFSTESVAEATIGLMLTIARNFKAAHSDALAGNWNFLKFCGVDLRGRTLLVVGAGRIGKRVGELARAFGMQVIETRSTSTRADLNKLAQQADFVSVHCPLTSTTKHLLDDTFFAAAKRGMFVINSARGGVIDERALLEALNSGIVAAAALDVYEAEPPDSSNPLLTHERVFTTPHCTWSTFDALSQLSESVINNVHAYLAGQPLRDRVI